MKKCILFLFMGCCFPAGAQTMTTEEKNRRAKADFALFIKDVRRNSRTGCLCTNHEYVVFSFHTRKAGTASLCVSKKISDTAGYLIYRFGTKGRTELAFPEDTANAFSKFSFAHYNRGGGKANAARYINSLHFTNGDFTYTLHDDWNSDGNHQAKGLMVLHNKTGKEENLNARGRATGTLWVFANYAVVQESDDL